MNAITTNICRWGNSRGIRLPKAFLEMAGFGDKDEVSLTAGNGTITIAKVEKEKRPYPSLLERFASYDGDYTPQEWNTGPSVGKEI